MKLHNSLHGNWKTKQSKVDDDVEQTDGVINYRYSYTQWDQY